MSYNIMNYVEEIKYRAGSGGIAYRKRFISYDNPITIYFSLSPLQGFFQHKPNQTVEFNFRMFEV